LDLEANHQVTEQEMKDNFENRVEYVGIIETPYHNSMFDRVVDALSRLPDIIELTCVFVQTLNASLFYIA
jgi:hypothetical protein